MKETLVNRFQELVSNVPEQKYEIISHTIDALEKKLLTKKGFFSTLFQMDREFNGNTFTTTMPLNEISSNHISILHGGVTATLIDETMGSLAHSLLPKGYSVVTTQLNIYYLSPGVGDYVTCKATVGHKSNKSFVLSADVFCSDGEKIAQATGSFFIVSNNKLKNKEINR